MFWFYVVALWWTDRQTSRLMVAEWLLGKALQAAPRGRPESEELAVFVQQSWIGRQVREVNSLRESGMPAEEAYRQVWGRKR